MSPTDGGQRDAPPVLGILMAGLVVVELAIGDIDSGLDALSITVRGALVVTWGLLALTEHRSRVTVDDDGIHWLRPLRRLTYRWDDIAAIRPGRRTVGKPHVELVRHHGGVVALPNSGDHLDDLHRWHAAATAGR